MTLRFSEKQTVACLWATHVAGKIKNRMVAGIKDENILRYNMNKVDSIIAHVKINVKTSVPANFTIL
jgi:hypothetical protein